MELESLLNISPTDLLEEKGKGVKLLARNTNWDKERIEGEEGGVVKEESQFIELGLGICADGYGGPSHVNIKQSKGTPPITPSQLHELNQQALIFKYILAGIPVPFPLVFPIWKSVACSFGSGGEVYNKFPSCFSPRGIDYRSLMDPEPGRCRRTDGKKWRCGKNVVSDQKYCERHMHRGRLSSRKPVEAAENISQSNTSTTTCSNRTKQTIKSHDPAGTNSKFPVLGNHQMLSFKRSNNFPATVASTTTFSANGNSNVFVSSVTSKPGAINNSNIDNCSTDITTTTVTNTIHDADTDNVIGRKNSKYVDGKVAGFNRSDDKKNSSGNIKNGNNQSGFVTPGFVFTLKSVRHDYTSSSKSSCDHRSATEVEPQRCRRTDGKKWRCSRDVVPQQKYCDNHMHRGAKRLVVSEAVTVAAASPPLAIPKNDHINLNITTDRPQPTSDDVNNSTSGSSSDATTITDENTSVSHLLALSP